MKTKYLILAAMAALVSTYVKGQTGNQSGNVEIHIERDTKPDNGSYSQYEEEEVAQTKASEPEEFHLIFEGGAGYTGSYPVFHGSVLMMFPIGIFIGGGAQGEYQICRMDAYGYQQKEKYTTADGILGIAVNKKTSVFRGTGIAGYYGKAFQHNQHGSTPDHYGGYGSVYITLAGKGKDNLLAMYFRYTLSGIQTSTVTGSYYDSWGYQHQTHKYESTFENVFSIGLSAWFGL